VFVGVYMAENRIADDHNRRYKYLFSHPRSDERLLASFVNEPFVTKLDFSTLERVNLTFVPEEFARHEANAPWVTSGCRFHDEVVPHKPEEGTRQATDLQDYR
jgi:hypothetical protein